MVHLIFKGSGWTRGGSSQYSPKPVTKEEQLVRKIRTGSMTDRDIQDALDSGDSTVKREMDKKLSEGHRQKKWLDHELGKGVADAIDDKGRPFKDIPTDLGYDDPRMRLRGKTFKGKIPE